MIQSVTQQLDSVVQELVEEVEREKETLKECRGLGCMNTSGSGMAMGSIDSLELAIRLITSKGKEDDRG